MERRENDMRNSEYNNKHLYRLGELDDYKVASEDPDVRGWTIVDRDNREFGRINELIVDVDKEKVRYLDVVPTGRTATSGEEEQHLLLPIGIASLDNREDRVVIKDIDRDLLNSYPAHSGDVITRDYEYSVVERFNSPEMREAQRADQDFYQNRLYDEERFYTNRTRNRPL